MWGTVLVMLLAILPESAVILQVVPMVSCSVLDSGSSRMGILGTFAAVLVENRSPFLHSPGLHESIPTIVMLPES